jgi:hypothetical protein
MGTKLKVVLCDEHGIGGSGEYFGDNDTHLDKINVFFFFGFSFLIQRPLSCSPTAARHFASLGQQGAARRGAFLCAWPLAREVRLWRT